MLRIVMSLGLKVVYVAHRYASRLKDGLMTRIVMLLGLKMVNDAHRYASRLKGER